MDLEIVLQSEGAAYSERCRQSMGFKESIHVFCRGMPSLILKQVVNYHKSKAHFAQYRLSFGPRGGPKIEAVDRLNEEPEPFTPNPLLELVRHLHDVLVEYDEHGIATGYLKYIDQAREVLGLPLLTDREVQNG